MVELVVGADVGGTNIKWVLMPATGSPSWQGEVGTDVRDPATSLRSLRAEVLSRLQGTSHRLLAVGVACAGIVSSRTGWLGRSPNLPGWEEIALGQVVSEVFNGLPSVLANDVNAALYGEYRLGAGRDCRNLVMIALGTGVGGGVLVEGSLVTGAADGAGEIGHMVLDPQGPVCTCGNRGCLEAYAGSVALIARARQLAADEASTTAFRSLVLNLGSHLSTADLCRLAETADPTARELFHQAGCRLGQAVANCVNLLDPDRVIIGGGVAQAGDLVLDPCRQFVAKAVLSEGSRHLPVIPAALGPFAAAMGVATLAREQEAVP